MKITKVVDRDFRKQVLLSEKPVLVVFTAAWCKESLKMAQVAGSMAKKLDTRIQTVIVDTEKNDITRRVYKVNRLPVTMLFKEGKCVDFVGGLVSTTTISKMIDKYLSPVLEIDQPKFETEVLKSTQPVLVHFNAAWCRQSKALVHIVDKVAANYQGKVKVTRLEFDESTKNLSAKYGVTRVPSILLFVNGQVEDQIFGDMSVGASNLSKDKKARVNKSAFNNLSKMVGAFAL